MSITLKKCNLCPHKCGVNRLENKIGICKATNNVKLALANMHYFEEPCISGKTGSGTVFFSNCNLNCVFCQNYKISQLGFGEEITTDRLAEIFIELQKIGANNINLVSPTIYSLQIKEAIKKAAKDRGLTKNEVYHTSKHSMQLANCKSNNGYSEYTPSFPSR